MIRLLSIVILFLCYFLKKTAFKLGKTIPLSINGLRLSNRHVVPRRDFKIALRYKILRGLIFPSLKAIRNTYIP